MASLSQTLQDMRDFVRDDIDTDDQDLPNALLDRFILDGANRVEAFSTTWDFRAIDYTFSTTAGQQAYDIRTPNAVAGITGRVVTITDLRGPNWILSAEPHAKMRNRYQAANTNNSANPYSYSLWGSMLYLWPTPTTTISLSLTGYRAPTDWVSVNGAPDYPDDLTELIEWWALSRAHAREGDPGMASFYASEFAVELQKRSINYLGGLKAQPLSLNSDAMDGGDGDWRTAKYGGPIYDWELGN